MGVEHGAEPEPEYLIVQPRCLTVSQSRSLAVSQSRSLEGSQRTVRSEKSILAAALSSEAKLRLRDPLYRFARCRARACAVAWIPRAIAPRGRRCWCNQRGSEAQKRIFKVAIVKRIVTLSGLGLRWRAFRSAVFHRALLRGEHRVVPMDPFDACDP
jgi:hypothetical protein